MAKTTTRKANQFVVNFGEFQVPEPLAAELEVAIRKVVLLHLARWHYADADHFDFRLNPEWRGLWLAMHIGNIGDFNKNNPGTRIQPATIGPEL